MGLKGRRALRMLQNPPNPSAQTEDPPKRPRHEGLASPKHSPCHELPEYLLEYFIISEGAKLSPA